MTDLSSLMPGPVLVLVAHPDDETLGCGGTIARLVAGGVEVTASYLTDGVGARTVEQRGTAIDARRAASLGASAALGCPITRWGGTFVPDNEADTISRLQIAKGIEMLIARHRPATVLTHSRADLNIDHRRVHEAVLSATRPKPGALVRQVLAFEVPSSTEWGVRPFRPSLWVELSAGPLGAKLAALACYDVESPPFPHPRSAAAVRALAEVRGAQAGVMAAEAFEIIRIVA